MKRIIAFVLMLVLVFSMGVPSFAATADDQATSLQSGWGAATSAPSYPTGYSSSWFYRIAHNLFNIYDIQSDLKTGWSDTLTPTGFSGSFYSVIRNSLKTINTNLDYIEVDIEGIYSLLSSLSLDVDEIKTDVSLNLGSIDSSLSSLLDIVPDIESIASSAVSINTSSSSSASSLSSIDSTLDIVFDYLSVSLDSYLSNQALFLSSISDDISMLQHVHADEDDLVLKEDSKPMEEFFTDNFFNSESDLSLNVNDLRILTQYVREFKTGYNFQENIGNPLPLTLIDSVSDFKDWFSDSTGQAMDPSFSSGEPQINNLLTNSYEFPYLGDPGHILDDDGFLEGHYFTTNADPNSLTYEYISDSNYNCTGFMEFDPNLPIYLKSSHDIRGFHEVVFCDSSLTEIYSLTRAVPHVEDDIYKLSVPSYVTDFSYFCLSKESLSGVTPDVIIYQEDTSSAANYSLRSPRPLNNNEVVTSYYADRMAEVERIKGGNN